jgi:excisionase family DNA binding protein
MLHANPKLRHVERSTMDRLLTADEIAERLFMKTEWVCAQARAGGIPHVRLGRYRRFRESAVEAWLRDLETGGTTTRSARAQPRCAAARSQIVARGAGNRASARGAAITPVSCD